MLASGTLFSTQLTDYIIELLDLFPILIHKLYDHDGMRTNDASPAELPIAGSASWSHDARS